MDKQKIGIAGLGAMGSTVARALQRGIDGFEWVAASEKNPSGEFDIPLVDFPELAARCDLIVECLPPGAVPALAQEVFTCGKNLVLISSAALILYPEILQAHKKSKSRIIVPSGALAGFDGVNALKQTGIKKAVIRSTKPPRGLAGAPYIAENKIDLAAVRIKERIFAGNVLEAARGFPANVNVAATLSLAGIGSEKTMVEVWADPYATTNSHEIEVESEFSTIRTHVDNKPDPQNPKSSMLAAQSIIATLLGLTDPLVIL